MPVAFSQRVTIAPDVMHRMVGEEAVLLNLKTEMYLGLNAVGARMWDVLKEAPSVQLAYDTLREEYEVDPETLRQDLDEFLSQLLKQELIEVAES